MNQDKNINWFYEYYDYVEKHNIPISKHIKKLKDKVEYDLDNGAYWDLEAGNKPLKFFKKYFNFEAVYWQRFVIFTFFAIYEDITIDGEIIKKRFYREMLLEIARGHGKTPLAALIMIYKWFIDKDIEPQFYNIALTKDQAALIFGYLSTYVDSPALKSLGYSSIGRGESSKVVKKDKKNFKCNVLSSKDLNTLQGVNYSLCIFDEVHALKDITIYTGMIQAQKHYNASTIAITTGGEIDNGVYDYLCDKAIRCLKSPEENYKQQFLPFLYRVDDPTKWNHEEELIKANPSWNLKYFYGSKTLIQNGIEDIKFHPELKADFLRKRCNLKVTSSNKYFEREIFEYDRSFNEDKLLEELKYNEWFVGIDLAEWRDLSSVVFITHNDNDGKTYIISKSFISEKGYQEHVKKGIMPLAAYKKNKELIIAGKDNTDYNVLIDYIEEMNKKMTIEFVGYDPSYSEYMLEEFANRFGWYEKEYLSKIATTPANMSPQMKKIKELLINKKLMFNSIFLKEQFLNIDVIEEIKGHTKLYKPDNKNKFKLHDEAVATFYATLAEYRWKKDIMKKI